MEKSEKVVYEKRSQKDYSMSFKLEVVENLQDLEDEGDLYENIEEIWPDYPSREDFLFNEDEY